MKRAVGLTLVEILVALLVLQMALLALAPMFVYATRSTSSAGDLGEVGVIATERMEQLRAIGFDALAAGGSLVSDEVGFSDTSDPRFIERWTVTDDATPPTMKTVEVRVVARRRGIGADNQIVLYNIVAQEPDP